jgi:hypothetical protein
VTIGAQNPNWARLFRAGRDLINQVNSEQTLIDDWTFGGGTAMMLQIDHRESRDVDIFLTDPQLLALLDPEKRDFTFAIRPDDFSSDGSRFRKFFFGDIGEVDFIIARVMTARPTVIKMVEGAEVALDTIPEIIAKKIYYRGSNIKPRDIFDIAAAGEQHAAPVIKALRDYREEVARTLREIETLDAAFIRDAIDGLSIRDAFRPIAKTALARATEILRAV